MSDVDVTFFFDRITAFIPHPLERHLMSALTIQHRDSVRTLRAAMPLNGEWSQNDCATPSYQQFAKVNTV